MKLKKYKQQAINLFILITMISLGFIGNLITDPLQAQASPIISKETMGAPCYERGDCSLNNFIGIIEASYTTIFGFIGSLALIIFIIGGVMFLISGGSQDKITKARNLMVSAIIGLLIVFASYLIINFVLNTMGYANVDTWNTTPGASQSE